MYKCLDCGAVFEEPKEYAEDRTPGGSFEGGSFIEHFTGCPYCEGAYEEAKQCEICGEYFTSDELTDTTEYINGGCGDCCEQCIEDGGMICL
jgi:hypothetical protein